MDWGMFLGGAVCGVIVFYVAGALYCHADDKKAEADRDLDARMRLIAERAVVRYGALRYDDLSGFIGRTNAALAKIDPPKRRKGDKK